MKNILTIAISLAFINGLFAQETRTEDTTKVRVGKNSFVISSDGISVKNPDRPAKADGHWAGLGIGLNLLAGPDGDVDLPRSIREWENEPIRSLTWNLNLYDVFVPLTNDRYSLGLITGIGLTYRSFSFYADDQDIVTNKQTTFLQDNPEGLNYDKRKFRITYISAPALLGFNTSLDKKKNFHISTGVIGNVRIGSLYKQKYTQGGDEKKIKTRKDFNLSPLTLDYSIRVGYRGVTAFFNYGLTPLFKDGRGPDVIPMTIGIQL